MDVDALLLDIDGVLATSWQPLDGAVPVLDRIKDADVPFKLLTNTTTHTRAALARTLNDAGFTRVAPGDIVTAVTGAARYLSENHPNAGVFLLSDGDATDDLEGVALTKPGEPAEVVAIGGACNDFTYANLNHAFRLIIEGAALVGLHRNMYWRTNNRLELDGGAFIAGLEEATGGRATICGKPAPQFFEAALTLIGSEPERTAMVGDDIVNDVLGAQAVGLKGVLVRTGKFMPEDLEKGEADHVIDSIADLPALIGIG
jgi:HAD superfamily hydrolase (TIGR01458 family)